MTNRATDLSEVYVMAPEFGPVKVGFSSQPLVRLSAVRNASGTSLTIRYLVKVGSEALRIEGAAHRLLSKYCVKPEWFDCSVDEAVTAIRRACADLGVTGQEEVVDLSPRKNGRPATGTDPAISVRLPKDVLEAVERCVDGDAIRNRSEAARHIIIDWLRSNQMLEKKV